MAMELLDQLGPDAFVTAEEGVITFANVLAHRLLGAEPGALNGTQLSRWVPAPELARVETIIAQHTQAFPDLPETFRLRFVDVKGQPIVVDARFSHRGSIRVFSLRDATESARGEALMSRLATLSRSGQGLLGANAVLDAAEPVFIELGWRGAFTRIVPLMPFASSARLSRSRICSEPFEAQQPFGFPSGRRLVHTKTWRSNGGGIGSP